MYHQISLKELRPQIPQVINKVDGELDRFIISKRGQPVAVLLSIDDFESLLETLNETEDEANFKRVLKGMAQAKAGKTVDWKTVKRKHSL